MVRREGKKDRRIVQVSSTRDDLEDSAFVRCKMRVHRVLNLRVKSFARQAPHSCLESFKSRFRSHVRANVRAHFFGLTAFFASLLNSLYSALSRYPSPFLSSVTNFHDNTLSTFLSPVSKEKKNRKLTS